MDYATVCSLPKFNIMDQGLSEPEGEMFHIWIKCIGARAVTLHCHKTFEFSIYLFVDF
jgi:hypothetical protein